MSANSDGGSACRGTPLSSGAPEKDAPAGDQSSPTGNQSAVVSALKRTGSVSTTTAVVTVVQPKAGKQQKSSWVWKAMQEFKPP